MPEDGRIENVFSLNIMNTEEQPHRYAVSVSGLPGIAIPGQDSVEVDAAASRSVVIPVLAAPDSGKAGANTIEFSIVAGDDPSIRQVEKASFILPR